MFNKKQKLITRWIVVKTLKEVKSYEIRGFNPESLVCVFKTFESAYKFTQTNECLYGYMQVYPITIEK